MFSSRIRQCRDSHVHWLATGEMADRLNLKNLTQATDVNQLDLGLYRKRGSWLLGFGWDQNQWPQNQFPHHRTLDEAFGHEFPMAFSRVDGHAVWVNEVALRLMGLFQDKSTPDPLGGRILRDEKGWPTGVFIDSATKFVDQHIPEPSAQEVRRSLLKGMKVFNQAGLTHIRDMSCDAEQLHNVLHLEQSGLLSLAVEQYFHVFQGQTFDQALSLALQARQQGSVLVRPQGLKVFLDGALGSEGAWLSCPYQSGSGHGLVLMDLKDLADIMRKTWEHQFSLAVHVIGDEAAHQTLLCFDQLWSKGCKGSLHLEHAEILRTETIELMKGRPIQCHLQPCHWLSDHPWLALKLGDFRQYSSFKVFPWRALQEAQVHFDFGSDSPIEPPSLINNMMALEKSSSYGIEPLLGDPLLFHSHPDPAWIPNCYTIFSDGVPVEVVFNGEHLL